MRNYLFHVSQFKRKQLVTTDTPTVTGKEKERRRVQPGTQPVAVVLVVEVDTRTVHPPTGCASNFPYLYSRTKGGKFF